MELKIYSPQDTGFIQIWNSETALLSSDNPLCLKKLVLLP